MVFSIHDISMLQAFCGTRFIIYVLTAQINLIIAINLTISFSAFIACANSGVQYCSIAHSLPPLLETKKPTLRAKIW
jgi:hypothetical protein